MVSLLPFFPVYMSYLGLSAMQTGIIRGIEPFMDFLVTPLWGALADKYSRHRTVLISTMIASGILYCSTYFVPRTLHERTEWTNLTNSTHITFVNDINDTRYIFDIDCESLIGSSRKHGSDVVNIVDTKSSSITCFRSDKNINTYCCKISPVESATIDIEKQINNEVVIRNSSGMSLTLTFGLMLFLIFAAKIFFCPTGPIIDTVAMALSEELNNDYGKQRLWGAASWGLFGVISGATVDACTKYCPPQYTYLPAFAFFAGFIFLAVLTASTMQFHTHQSPQSMSRNIWPLLTNPEILVFLLLLFVYGIASGVTSTYLFLFLQELDGPHSLMGLTLTMSCVAEIPLMYYSKRVIACFGHKSVFYLSLLEYGLKLLIYSVLQNPWLVLPIEVLHGVCYGVFWPAATSYCDLIAPGGMQATVQTVAWAINCGIGEYCDS